MLSSLINGKVCPRHLKDILVVLQEARGGIHYDTQSCDHPALSFDISQSSSIFVQDS